MGRTDAMNISTMTETSAEATRSLPLPVFMKVNEKGREERRRKKR